MTAAQAQQPKPCEPTPAPDNGELVSAEADCFAHAATLVLWIEALQRLIEGEGEVEQ